jgi:hypothetical protein
MTPEKLAIARRMLDDGVPRALWQDHWRQPSHAVRPHRNLTVISLPKGLLHG